MASLRTALVSGATAGTERPVETRPMRETLLHWTAALSFSLTLAYLYARSEHGSASVARGRIAH